MAALPAPLKYGLTGLGMGALLLASWRGLKKLTHHHATAIAESLAEDAEPDVVNAIVSNSTIANIVAKAQAFKSFVPQEAYHELLVSAGLAAGGLTLLSSGQVAMDRQQPHLVHQLLSRMQAALRAMASYIQGHGQYVFMDFTELEAETKSFITETMFNLHQSAAADSYRRSRSGQY